MCSLCGMYFCGKYDVLIMLPFVEAAGFEISMYALCIMVGLAVGIIVAVLRAGVYQYQKEDVLFASFYGILGVAVGGKILYLFTVIPFFVENFAQITWNLELLKTLMTGGFVFYGGLLGALGGIFIYTRQYKLSTGFMVEIIMPSVPLIHAFGRIGCFFAGCCYGREFPAPVGMQFLNSFIAPNDRTLFPVQLVEAAGNLVLFLVLMAAFGKKKTQGQITAVYFIGYSLMRFFLEYFRADAERGIFLGISTSQWISIGILAAGCVLAKRAKK